MTKPSTENLSVSHDAINVLEEAIRQYRLPFGVGGKWRTYRTKPESEWPAKAKFIVLQDFRVLTPPEYIFSLHPVDCVSVTVDVTKYQTEYAAQIDFLMQRFEPPVVIFSAPLRLNGSAGTLKTFATSVIENARGLGELTRKELCDVRMCTVDEEIREIVFI